jgi:hypothetical protein
LDLVITFDDQAIIVIEVKKGDAEGSDTEKHTGYNTWLEARPHTRKDRVFLAVTATAEEYRGFSFRSWANVCINMRNLAVQLCRSSQVSAAAMVVAFTAAVEQNLLGFSAELVRSIEAGRHVFFNPRIVDHMQQFVAGGE